MSGTIGAYRVLQSGSGRATEEQINSVLTDWSITGNAVFGVGLSFGGNANGAYVGVLAGSPSLDAAATWTWDDTAALSAHGGYNPDDYANFAKEVCK